MLKISLSVSETETEVSKGEASAGKHGIMHKSNKKIINAWAFHRYAFNWTIMGGLSRSNQEYEYIEEYKKCAKSLRKNFFQAIKVKIPIKSKLMYICIAICPNLMAKREKRKVRY